MSKLYDWCGVKYADGSIGFNRKHYFEAYKSLFRRKLKKCCRRCGLKISYEEYLKYEQREKLIKEYMEKHRV